MTNVRMYLKLSAGLIIALSACKPKGSSDLKTVENLAAGSQVRANMCHGDIAKNKYVDDVLVSIDVQDEKLKTRLRDELYIALTALPKDYIDAYYALHGKFIITPDSAALCSLGGKAGAPNVDVTACTLQISAGAAKMHPDMEGLIVVLKADPGVIRHSTVRTFGYMFSQLLAHNLSFDNPALVLNPKFYADLQMKLSLAFLSDMGQSKLFNIKNLEPLLGADADTIIRRNIAEMKAGKSKDLFKGLTVSKDKIAQFTDYVVADTFDSYHCQAVDESKDTYDPKLVAKAKAGDLGALSALSNTRNILRDFFPRTAKAFFPVNAYLDRVASILAKLRVPTAATTAPKAGSGLNLTDTRRAGVESRFAEYNQRMASPPTYWERTTHPFEGEDGRRTRLMNDYLGDRQAYLNYQRQDAAAKAGTPPPPRIDESGANSVAWAATKGAASGVVTGAGNVVVGTTKAVVGTAVGVAGVTYIAATEGPGVAVNKVVTAFQDENGKDLANKFDAIDARTADGGYLGAAHNLALKTLAVGSKVPIAGNLIQTAENTAAVLSERDPYSGKPLTPQETEAFANKQGDVAGKAILEAGTAAATQFGAEKLAAGASGIATTAADAVETTANSSIRTIPQLATRFAAQTAAPTVRAGAEIIEGAAESAAPILDGAMNLPISLVQEKGIADTNEFLGGGEHEEGGEAGHEETAEPAGEHVERAAPQEVQQEATPEPIEEEAPVAPTSTEETTGG